MGLKNRVEKIETNRSPISKRKICFQNQGETLKDAIKRMGLDADSSGNLLVVRWQK